MKRSKWINGGEAPAYVVVVYDFRSFYIGGEGAEREHVLESIKSRLKSVVLDAGQFFGGLMISSIFYEWAGRALECVFYW